MYFDTIKISMPEQKTDAIRFYSGTCPDSNKCVFEISSYFSINEMINLVERAFPLLHGLHNSVLQIIFNKLIEKPDEKIYVTLENLD